MNSTVRLVDADTDAGGVAVLDDLVVGLVGGSGAQQSAQEYSLQQGRIRTQILIVVRGFLFNSTFSRF